MLKLFLLITVFKRTKNTFVSANKQFTAIIFLIKFKFVKFYKSVLNNRCFSDMCHVYNCLKNIYALSRAHKYVLPKFLVKLCKIFPFPTAINKNKCNKGSNRSKHTHIHGEKLFISVLSQGSKMLGNVNCLR